VDIKLNVGCGKSVFPASDGWLNYDVSPCSPEVIQWEAGQPFWVGDGSSEVLRSDSVQCILASHFIEHIPHSLCEHTWFSFWEECWRVLVPEGQVMVRCPRWDSPWAWGDPGHCRIIHPYIFSFTDAHMYLRGDAMRSAEKPMFPANSEYRPRCNFEAVINPFVRVDEMTHPWEADQLEVVMTKKPLPEGYLEQANERVSED